MNFGKIDIVIFCPDRNKSNKCIQMLFFGYLIINLKAADIQEQFLKFCIEISYVDHPVEIVPDFFSEKNFCCSE